MDFFAIAAAALSLMAGMALLVYRKEFARNVVRDQNRLWGFRFGEREARRSEPIVVLVAVGFLGFGVAALLGLLPFK